MRFVSACLTNMQSFVSQPVTRKLRIPAEPDSGPGYAAVKFHGTLSKKRITCVAQPALPGKTLSKLSNAAGAKTLYKIQFGFLEPT